MSVTVGTGSGAVFEATHDKVLLLLLLLLPPLLNPSPRR